MAAFTSKDQIKPGMRVRCVYSSIPDRYGKEATVVSVGSYIAVEWDDGTTLHTSLWGDPSSFEPIDQVGIAFGAHPVAQARQEKPCQVCGKPNDLGVKVCWMCGNHPG